MLSLGRHLWSRSVEYMFPNHTKETNRKLEEHLARFQDTISEDTTLQVPENKKTVKPRTTEGAFIRKTGTITKFEGNFGEIDGCVTFGADVIDSCSFGDSLTVKLPIIYTVVKLQNGNLKAVKIESIVGETWGDEGYDDDVLKQIREKSLEEELIGANRRSINALITDKNGSLCTYECENETKVFNMDDVEMSFKPEKGDSCLLECMVEHDETMFDCAGGTVKVLKCTYTRLFKDQGRITELYEGFGRIDKDIVFDVDVIDGPKDVKVGDIVDYTAVEYCLGDFSQRCIKVTLAHQVNDNRKYDPQMFTNKEEIVISDEIRFLFNEIDEENVKEIHVSNLGKKTRKIDVPILLSPAESSQMSIMPLEEKTLEPGKKAVYKISAKSRFFGKSEEVFVFCIDGGNFKIARKITIHVGGSPKKTDQNNGTRSRGRIGAILEQRLNNAAFNAHNRVSGDVVPGVPTKRSPNFIDKRLRRYDIPKAMFDIILSPSFSRHEKEEELEKRFPVLGQDLTKSNYRNLFHNLLFLEQTERYLSMRRFDRDRACFKREGPYLALEMERIMERKPSVIIGDSVKASRPWTDDTKEYQGFIHKIFRNRVLLKFNEMFQESYNGEDYKLYFEYSKSDFQKNHHALDELYDKFGVDYCFPVSVNLRDSKMDMTITKIGQLYRRMPDDCYYEWFNPVLNRYQKEAVKNVIRAETRPMPYIIFGPPGTGKTITMVEAILQIWALFPDSRIIVGTPSNSSANLIAERLIKAGNLKPGDLIRIVSQNVIEREAVPEFLTPYSGTIDIAADRASADAMIVTASGLKLKMRRSQLIMHRIFVGTCVTLGAMMQIKFPRNHFTHVFMDEAGQLLETETLIPIGLLSKRSGQVVLAGDPRQLGPVIGNNYAKSRGLGYSLMERVLNLTPYQRDRDRFEISGYDPRLVTKLRINYRSIPAILSLYSELFYDSELIKDVCETESSEALLLKRINNIFPNSDNPLKIRPFHVYGVNGQNAQDPDSPSWFNFEEAKTVFNIFIKMFRQGVMTSDIGIISPYQKQAQILKKLIFEVVPERMPKIGSVEEFQGQERNIIIVTTVRSSSYLIGQDLECHLGFVKDKKRLNVLISRARACLIIVGNPNLLSTDVYWRKLIEKAIELKTYSGCTIMKNLGQKEH